MKTEMVMQVVQASSDKVLQFRLKYRTWVNISTYAEMKKWYNPNFVEYHWCKASDRGTCLDIEDVNDVHHVFPKDCSMTFATVKVED